MSKIDPLFELLKEEKQEQGRKRKFERSDLAQTDAISEKVSKVPKVSEVSEVSEKSESSDEIKIDVKAELKKHITKGFDEYSIIFNERSEREGFFGKVYDLKSPSGSDCQYVVKILNCMNSSIDKNIDDYNDHHEYQYLIKLYNECNNLRYMNENENTTNVTVKYFGIMKTFIPNIGKGLYSYGIVMEKMDGNLSDLYSKIFQSGDNHINNSITSKRIFNIILYFIYNLNKANIFHSDFKDSNILYKKIDEKYCLKISDVEFIKRNSKENNEFLELICFHSMLGSSVSGTIQSLLKYNIVQFMGKDYDEKYISSLEIAPGERMHSQYQEIMNNNNNKSLSDHVHEIINENFEAEAGLTRKTNCFIVQKNLKKDGRKKSHRKKSLKKKSHRKKSLRKKSHRKKSHRKKSHRKKSHRKKSLRKKSKRKSKKH